MYSIKESVCLPMSIPMAHLNASMPLVQYACERLDPTLSI